MCDIRRGDIPKLIQVIAMTIHHSDIPAPFAVHNSHLLPIGIPEKIS